MGRIENGSEAGEPDGEAEDDLDRASPRSARLNRHMKSLTFHRAIHRILDDGALIALCENYGAEENEPKAESQKRGK